MKEKRYDVQVLDLLLDKYERSSVYQGTAKRNLSISIPVTRKQFPDYFDLTSTAYEHMNAQMENLENLGLVKLIWQDKRPDGILKKIQLDLMPDSLSRSYAFVSRKTRRDKEKAVLAVLEEHRDEFPAFVSAMESRMQRYESVRQYIDPDHPEQLEKILYLAGKIRENREDIFLRKFSIEVFHDSKIAEHEIGSAVSILTHFPDTDQKLTNDMPDERLKELTTDEVLEEYNIYRNPSWVMLKGCGAPLHLPMGIGISNGDIDRIPWDTKSVPERIITIENLTSFHQWKILPDGRDLVIYLGGYANRARREMLLKLHGIYPKAEYFHFGDLDAGGFRIWKNLSVSTGLSIGTLLMDEKTYRQYLGYGKDLTEHDIRALKKMMEDPFFENQRELFRLMLGEGKKIEQECVG